MERAMVARLNIEHYKHLLATDTDEFKREIVLRLLAEEEAILAETVGDGANELRLAS